jgi:predicted glycosyltransferase
MPVTVERREGPRVWIDFSNSPHPLLFAPIVRELEAAGCQVLLTARDHAQTLELARERWTQVNALGRAGPGGRAAKAGVLLERIRQLTGWARTARPDVALSHNSYAQIVAARALRIPAVTAMDYEHQPANHLAFRLARSILLPEALRGTDVHRQGAAANKTRFYDGLKEELYLGDFEPDPAVRARLGIADDRPLLVLRTPPTRATYHRFGNELFDEVLHRLARDGAAWCVLLARHPEHRAAAEALDAPNIVVPAGAVDARSLMSQADAVVGAGGTMTREAALLGVPTWSVFAGRPAAVDSWLEESGLLRRLSSADELLAVHRRRPVAADLDALRRQGARLVGEFVRATLEAARR